jgi:hypothetical protein
MTVLPTGPCEPGCEIAAVTACAVAVSENARIAGKAAEAEHQHAGMTFPAG